MIKFEVKDDIHFLKLDTEENSFSPEFMNILNQKLDLIENFPR